MVISCSEVMVSNLESNVQRKLLARPSILNRITESSGRTNGRTFKLCGATGVKMKLPEFGNTIGPPPDKEYPVEPVGVLTIKPSAQ